MQKRKMFKPVCANVDFYSVSVYSYAWNTRRNAYTYVCNFTYISARHNCLEELLSMVRLYVQLINMLDGIEIILRWKTESKNRAVSGKYSVWYNFCHINNNKQIFN